MPSHYSNDTTTTTTTEIKWFGDEILFTTAGGKKIKLWQIIVGLILLSMLLPFFRKRNNK